MALFSDVLWLLGTSTLSVGLTVWWLLFRRRQPPPPAFFTEREMEFNRKKLETDIVRQSEQLYDYRNDESHRVYTDYLRSALNLEVLRLTDGKVPDVDYAYHRGRVDALRAVLNTREVAIQNKEMLRRSEGKDPQAQEAKRSYVRAPATSAGLSI